MRKKSTAKRKSHTGGRLSDVLAADGLLEDAEAAAKAVLQGMASYEETRETFALIKSLALGNKQIEVGKTASAQAVVKGIRKRYGK